ncbi:hypothetical protein [Thermodesulforhabdus norvegica]|uniref:Uncharacterized protein n=1 Tax=Thermodesulforhabdus norvegica TaxID=39841 RepID=A0A1I4UKQ9_9BACT|nr:hypothetical protein [Thermodesulforhabdus norvegica]SFM89562.1 hypothetical protein SAMN05660836_01853 [Thermodesulforhabdus norvegica]
MKGRRLTLFLPVLFLLALSIGVDSRAEDLVAQTGFDAFCREWLHKLKTRGCYSPERPCELQDKSDPEVKITGYSSIEKVTSMVVKKTLVPESPYVGILKYSVINYCLEEGNTDQFKPCGYQNVTEIFSYRNGKWTY